MDIGKYLNVPFKRHVHQLDGFDCWGLIVVYYKEEFGIELPNHPLSVEKQIWDDIPYEDILPGDAFGMGIMGISHVGLVISKDVFLHTTSAKGYSHLVPAKNIMSRKKFLGFMRLKEDYK